MANTTNASTLTTDFNVTPYYDDYDATKNFYRILFKPGYAVQARELTQAQTILQKQIDRFGKHVFKEGSIVIPGSYFLKAGVGDKKGNPVDFIKIKDVDVSNNTVIVSDYLGATFVGATSNIHAYVTNVLDSDGTAANTKTLYVTYLNASTSNSTLRKFSAGETLTSNVGTAIVLDNDPVANTGYASSFEIESGVFFAKEHFIYFPTQSVILDRYNPNPTCKVGFFVDEELVNPSADASLLDPALESSNYAAPGADRLKLVSTLSVVPFDFEDTTDFVTLFTIRDGVIQTIYEKSQYNILGDSLATRTYEESGDYVVRGLSTQINEHDLITTPVSNNGRYANGNNQLLVITVDPGLAYVKGYPVQTYDRTDIEIQKPKDFKNVTSQITSTTMGQYLQVSEFVGTWELDKGNRVSFYDVVEKRITNGGVSTGQKWSVGSQSGNNIGSGIVNSVEYVSGTPGYDAIYNIYLSDIKMAGSNSFANVRSVYKDNSTVADDGADILGASNSSSNTSLLDLNKSTLLYYTGSSSIKTVRDTSGNPTAVYYFNNTDGVSSGLSIGTDGTFTVIYTGPANQFLPYTSGPLNDTDVRQDIRVTCGQSFNIGPLWSGATISASGTTITGAGTFFTRLNVGDKIEIAGQANTFYVTSISNNTTMTVSAAVHPSVTGNTVFKAYKVGDTIDMTGKGSLTGAERTVSATSTTLAFDLKETLPTTIPVTVTYKVASTQSAEAAKVLRPNRYVKIDCSTAGTTGPFPLGFSDIYKINKIVKKSGSAPTTINDGTDVTSFFTLDNGQRDTFYDIGSIVKSSTLSLTASDYLLIDVDYFTQNFSSRAGFFTIDSYPIQDDDTLATSTTIRTENVPIFVSPVSGLSYDLRNHIDFRPVKSITATDATTVGTASTNPSGNSTTYNFSAFGMRFPIPSTEMIYDYSAYLGRKDIVVVNKDGQFSVVRGVPAEVPFAPESLETQMLLSILNITPYPSLSPAYANNLRRKDLACSAKKASNRRYTMRDIGVLDNRIKNLEYYTSLTLLEKDALNLKIVDDNGLDRFKNGIFIDTFKDASLTAKGIDKDYRIVTDPIELCIRPLFSTHSLGYEYISGSGVRLHDDGIVTLDYNETVQYAQNRVTDNRNLERGTYYFRGELVISPREDIWVDTSYAPDEVVTVDVQDGLVDVSVNSSDDVKSQIAKSLINTEWEGWKTRITGYNLYRGQGSSRVLVGTFTTEDEARRAASAWTTTQNGGEATLETLYNNSRVGTNYFANESTDVATGSNKLVSSEVIPYIRPQELVCHALGLKPYSKVNVFFDDTNVTAYCTPLTKAQYEIALLRQPLPITGVAAQGSDLIVNDDGNLYYLFKITSNGPKFRVGERRMVVLDGEQIAPQNVSAELDASTMASGFFFANGAKQVLQRTVYSTKGYLQTSEATSEQYNSFAQLVLPNTWTPPPPAKDHCCFDPNAKVLMADLSWKAIKDIVVGDKVMGHNGVINTVLKNKTIGVGTRKMLKFKDSSFYSTDDHLFLTKKGWKTWRPDIVLKSPDTSNGQFLIGDNRIEGINGGDFLKKVNVVDGRLVEEFVPYTSVEAEYHDFDSDYIVHDLTLDGNMTYIVEGYIVHNCCVAYTVLIRAPQSEEGVFVTSFDIYVARKSATRGLWFEVREVNNAGGVTSNQIPNSYVFVPNDQIPISANGNDNPLNVKFKSPIFMFNNKEYAFVVHSFSPSAFSVDPDTSLWISRLGETDRVTGARVNDRQNSGVFYQTINNKLWEPIADVDLKINVYRANFNTGTQSFIIGNERVEKVIFNNVTTSLSSKIGEYFTSGDRLAITGANGTISVGDRLQGNVSTSNANGTVVFIGGGRYETSNTRYVIGERVDAYNVSGYTGVSAVVTSIANTSGQLSYYSESSSTLYGEFKNSTGGYSQNTIIRGMRSDGYQYRANIGFIKDFTYSSVSFEPKVLDFIKTDIGYEMQTYANTSTTPSGFDTVIYPSETYYYNDVKRLSSRTNEIANLSGNRSNQIRVSMSSLSEYVSPVFDIETSHTVLIDNLINANTVGETGVSGGQAINKYISQTITLADGQEAEDIRIYLSSYRPPGTDVKVYVKLLQADDSEILKQKNWIELEKLGEGDGTFSSLANRFNFKEFQYGLPTSYMTGPNGEFQYTNGSGIKFTGYKYFTVKIVLTSTNSAIVPRVADLRCIALQL